MRPTNHDPDSTPTSAHTTGYGNGDINPHIPTLGRPTMPCPDGYSTVSMGPRPVAVTFASKYADVWIDIRYPAWTVPPLRQNDRYLMDDLADQGLPRAHLEKLNACRMFLQVTTLAEITDHTGSTLLSQALTSYRQPLPAGLKHISQSTLRWPCIHPHQQRAGVCGPQPFVKPTPALLKEND